MRVDALTKTGLTVFYVFCFVFFLYFLQLHFRAIFNCAINVRRSAIQSRVMAPKMRWRWRRSPSAGRSCCAKASSERTKALSFARELSFQCSANG